MAGDLSADYHFVFFDGEFSDEIPFGHTDIYSYGYSCPHCILYHTPFLQQAIQKMAKSKYNQFK